MHHTAQLVLLANGQMEHACAHFQFDALINKKKNLANHWIAESLKLSVVNEHCSD